MSRNVLYVLIGALVVVIGVVGYFYYQEQQTSSVDIEFGESGISIETK
ncbi:MAG: hypothetical protein KKH72_10165 [Alphaproteobacteria bacterium]|nr:hypothetical protein [Alphaproteobacteria bacterium]